MDPETKLEPGVYEECPCCEGGGTAQTQAAELFGCPACAGQGLVPHHCEAGTEQ